jgi:hypothetical protein
MHLYDTIYLIYEIVNEYLVEIKLLIDEDVWLEMMLISFINKNLDINLYHFINYFTRRMDTIILNQICDDIDQTIFIPRKMRFKINLLCRRINKKLDNLGLYKFIDKKIV